jgi:ADP-ribose pyrophosphatase YjhB (NUDIX family)
MNFIPSRFNIRVYGLLIEPETRKLLVCDEVRFGKKFTKFPGGGLELGEGILDGLRREWLEETGLDIQNPRLFYVNDFLQVSAFSSQDQIISIYYLIDCNYLGKLKLKNNRFDFDLVQEGEILFRLVEMEAPLLEEMSFPIDKIVVEKLMRLTGNLLFNGI